MKHTIQHPTKNISVVYISKYIGTKTFDFYENDVLIKSILSGGYITAMDKFVLWKQKESKFCKCEHSGIINHSGNEDITCAYCDKEVEHLKKILKK